jgi:hypothetical protein
MSNSQSGAYGRLASAAQHVGCWLCRSLGRARITEGGTADKLVNTEGLRAFNNHVLVNLSPLVEAKREFEGSLLEGGQYNAKGEKSNLGSCQTPLAASLARSKSI